jgi:regulator of RNase E activity RraA
MVADELIEGFRQVEGASVADAMEQLYGQRNYMSHSMRPLAPTKFAGRAVTVLMKREEPKDGAKASQGMLDAIDDSQPGSVYVMVLEDGPDFVGVGGLMTTALKARGFTGAIAASGLQSSSNASAGTSHTA